MEQSPEQVAQRAIALLDLTELGDAATAEQVETLCARAVGPHGPVAAVCVWPRHVALAVEHLWGTSVRVATVVNFPTGDEAVHDVLAMTAQALADGADEIDLVLPYRALMAGDLAHTAAMIDHVRTAVPADSHRLKVILETGELAHPDLIDRAARLAIEHGADFVKTSTGKTPHSASLQATGIMLQAIREAQRPVGLKPSGGIRTFDDAAEYLRQADRFMGPMWATPETFRFGASGLLDALVAVIDGARPNHTEGAY
ncbi:MAG: deoxyribose-phosphate aldolase [Actinomycetota bacterium]